MGRVAAVAKDAMKNTMKDNSKTRFKVLITNPSK